MALITGIGIFDRCSAVVFADVQFISEAGPFELEACLLGSVPPYVIHYAGGSADAVKQIIDSRGNGQGGLVVQA